MNTHIEEKPLSFSNISDLIVEQSVEEILEYLSLCSLEYQEYLLSRLMGKIDPIVLEKVFANGWHSATNLSKRLGISKQKFGRIVSKLNLRNNELLVKSFIIKVSELKYTKIYFYHEDILEIIEYYLDNEDIIQKLNISENK